MNIKDVGHTIQIAGLIMNDDKTSYLIYLPNEDDLKTKTLKFDVRQWNELIQQSDTAQCEILAQDESGNLKKILFRKNIRLLDRQITWNVFRRDNYTCQYCYRNNTPLTVDHLLTWEEGGPTIEDNLLTCCHRCNKLRGNMPYNEWLTSDKFIKVSKMLPKEIRQKNISLIEKINSYPRRYHKIKR